MKDNTISLAILVFISSMFIMASCEDEIIGKEVPDTKINNFEYFWKTFDTHYGMFDVKNVDWQKIHDEYRSKINDQTSDEELYNIFSAMIVQLNDNHLNLYPTNGSLPVFPGGLLRYHNGVLTILKAQADYDLEVVKKYISNYLQITQNIGYGNLSPEITYINIKGTDNLKTIEKELPKVIIKAESSKAIVIDVRGFYGGYDPASQLMAGFFASSKKIYMKTKKRNGPLHSDFTETYTWDVTPQSRTFIKPIILLTSRFTQSAGETFTLALKQFEHVKILGDTTAGSFSDNPTFELPNGWMFSVSVGDYRGPNDESYEGIGIPPNEYLVTGKDDLVAGRDKTLESALLHLK